MDKTTKLKQELWNRFGSKEHPVEWDGNVYGGGKLSQRYWEYFKAIELLSIDENSVVLDIGGGSPATGVGFFSSIIATVAQKVIVMDKNINANAIPPKNIEFIRELSSYDTLKLLFSSRSDITHISCLSVFEHIEESVREGIIRAIDEFYQGKIFVSSFEYHAKTSHLEYILTAKTVSDMFKNFTRFYLDDLSASPVWCENTYDETGIPRWYPVAVRFINHRI